MNAFIDNADLRFVFETMDLEPLIRLWEDDFREAGRFAEAPENVDDARDSYRRILELTGDIAGRIIAPRREALDREPNRVDSGRVIYAAPVQECLQALRQADLMGCTLSRQYGGLNLPNVVFTMLVELISAGDAGLQNLFGLQGIGNIIEAYADEETRQRYLPGIARGELTGAMALTEEDAGSDLQNIKMKAVPQADGTWHLHGSKRFITNGGAEVLLVLARSEEGTTDGLGLSLFLCERDETVRVRRLEEKLGIHSSPTCELTFDGTPARLIGERQRGLVSYVLVLLNGARLATAAQAVGIAQAALDEARAYAHARRQYGRRIEQIPPVADMITSMAISVEAGRALACETARVLDLSIGTARRLERGVADPDEKKRLRREVKKYERLVMLLTSCAKYYCSEMSSRVTSDAMQVLGGSGYMQDYPVEKYYRDARITSIYEGTSQMQIFGAVRAIMGGTMEKYFQELDAAGWTRQQTGSARRLARCRSALAKTSADLAARPGAGLVELCSRLLVDMAIDILIGYLLLQQGRHSSRKLKIARLFISSAEPQLKMRAARIRRTTTAVLKDFDLLAGPPLHVR